MKYEAGQIDDPSVRLSILLYYSNKKKRGTNQYPS